jgi:hypothetical protein
MIKLIVLLALLVGAFIGYPLINEDTSSTCDALERIGLRVMAETRGGRMPDQSGGGAVAQLLQGASQGQFARLAVRDQYPELPVSLGCALLYWKARIDPEGFRKAPLTLGR